MLTACGQGTDSRSRVWPDPSAQFSQDKQVYAQDNYQYADRELMFMWYAQLNDEPVDVVFLGDSITQRLEWHEVFPNLRVVNRGVGSDTTDGALARLDSVIALSPRVVSCMLGINDIAYGHTTEEIVTTYTRLLESIHSALPDTKVIVHSVLPVTEAHPIDNSDVMALNQALEQVCKLDYVEYLNIYDLFTDEHGNLSGEFAQDDVHLNPVGYTLWLKELESKLDM